MLLVPETLEGYRRQLKLALEQDRPKDAANLAEQLSSSRVAELLIEAPNGVVRPTLVAMSGRKAGRVLGQLPSQFAAQVLAAMADTEAPKLFMQMPLDHAADVLEFMPTVEADQLLSRVTNRFRQQLEGLKRYPKHSAGGAMIPHYLAIEPDKTVAQARDALTSAPPEVERTSYIYVVDAARKPIGVVSLRDLMSAEGTRTVEQVMNPNVVVMHVDDSAEDAARRLRARRFMMIPVIDDRDALVGVITFDAAIDILKEEVADRFAGFGGGTIDESFFTPPIAAVKGRLPWMVANVFLNLGAVAVITGFEATIAAVAILAAFLPMITDMGGNVGIQSLSVSIRSMALGEVRLRDFWKAIRKEVVIGLINGAALGSLFAAVAWLWQGDPLIGILAGIALGINVLVAGIAGGTLPFLIKRFGKDPALITGPILTTITDVTGVTIYLALCTIFLTNLLAG
jgi:magnesium transporter